MELLNYLNIYQGLGAYLLNIIAVMGVAFIIVVAGRGGHAVAATAAARAGTRLGQGQVAGRCRSSPIAAVISAISWGFVIYVAFHTGFGGTFGLKPMVEAFTAPAIGVVYYIGVRLVPRAPGHAVHPDVRRDTTQLMGGVAR